MTRLFRKAGLGLVAATVLALTLLPARDIRSQEVKRSPIEGAWKQVGQKNGEAEDYQKPPEGTEMIKYVTGGRFVWTIVRDGQIVAAAGGKYTVDKDKYTETIEYTHGEGQESLRGQTFNFTWKVDGNTWLHVGSIKVSGQEFKIDEKWERCK
jgi:hypothetical protein